MVKFPFYWSVVRIWKEKDKEKEKKALDKHHTRTVLNQLRQCSRGLAGVDPSFSQQLPWGLLGGAAAGGHGVGREQRDEAGRSRHSVMSSQAAQPQTTVRPSHWQGHCGPGTSGTERPMVEFTRRPRQHSTGMHCKSQQRPQASGECRGQGCWSPGGLWAICVQVCAPIAGSGP